MRKSPIVPRLLCLIAIVLPAAMSRAATPREPGFFIDEHLRGLGSVTALGFAPDGTLFIAEKAGTLKVLPFGAGSPRVFATISVYTASECGLLGVALDPDYAGYSQGGHVYVFATVSGNEQRIIRFRDASGTGSERTEIKTGLPTLGANHDGGCLRIGPDGKFYLAIGDGGSGSSKAQDVTNLFGKVMRLNLDGTIPGDNPDLSAVNANYRREIFAYGFRNPFRIAIRPTGPGPSDFQVFVDDVGSSGGGRREEVNLVLAGKNYGWPNVEGIAAPDPRYVNPIHAYSAEGNSIVGGVFYQGSLFPEAYRGDFFYMDYVSNKVFRMVLSGDSKASDAIFADAEGGLIDIAEGPDGALYYSTSGGRIYRIRYEASGNTRPTAVLAADPASGGAPLTVSFDAGGSTDSDGTIVRYDWSFGDGTSDLDAGPQVTHEYAIDGTFTARVTVRDDKGGAASATAAIEVATVDFPPVPEILAPEEDTAYDAGATVQLSGRALDPEDGELPGASLVWDVIILHPDDPHTHPIVEGLIGSEQSFELPTVGLAEAWNLTIILTATDSKGHKATAERLVALNPASLRLESDPPGFRLTADGVSVVAPGEYRSVNQAVVELNAPEPQDFPGSAPGTKPYIFKSWSDGGVRTHAVTATDGLLLTAAFEPDPRGMFLRGDSNRDGKHDISDAVYTLNFLFAGGPPPPCADAADANDDGHLDISDPVAGLNTLFSGAGALPEPNEAPGFDPTDDELRC